MKSIFWWRVATLFVLLTMITTPLTTYATNNPVASASEMESESSSDPMTESLEIKNNAPIYTDSILENSGKRVPDLDAEGVMLVEANTRQVVYSKNADKRMYPASTTKTLTALITYETFGEDGLDTLVTANSSAVNHSSLIADGSSAGIRVEEELTIRQLLYCLLLPSGNDAACVLAEACAGSVEAFVDIMNQRALDLGCKDTHFTNPHGLTNEKHYTTPQDLYCIAYEFATHSTLMEIANTTSITIPATNKAEERVLNTTNHLISTRTKSQYFYEYARGIKTGYTSAAKHCLITTAQKGDMYLICVVMKCPVIENKVVTSFTNSKKLYEWAFSTYEFKNILKKGAGITEAYVALSDEKDAVILETDSDVGILIPKGSYDETLLKVTPPDTVSELTAPFSKGELVAQANVTYNGMECGHVGLVTASGATLSQFMDVNAKADGFFKSTSFILILTAIPVLFILYVIYVSVASKNRRKKSIYGRRYR